MSTENQARPQVSESQIVSLLQQGMDRKEIKKKLGLNTAEAKLAFALPGVKKRRVLKGDNGVRVEFVRDISQGKEETQATTKATEDSHVDHESDTQPEQAEKGWGE